MNNDIKSFLINVLVGLFTAIVFIYLDKNGLTSLSYIVFALYVFLIFLIAYKIIKHMKTTINITDNQPNEIKDTNTKNALDDQFKQPNQEKFIYHNNLLWLSGDSAPYCPSCYEIDGKRIHVKFIHSIGEREEWKFYECPNCHYREDYDEHNEPPKK